MNTKNETYLNLKVFVQQRKSSTDQKDSLLNLKKWYANNMIGTGLIYKIYKQLIQFTIKEKV